MTTGQEIALYVFLAFLIGGSILMRQFLHGSYNFAGREMSRPLMITAFLLTFGSLLLNWLLK